MKARSFIQDRIEVDANGCWIWRFSVNKWGYGRIRHSLLGERATHRIAFRAFVGDIPEGILVLHKCDVPRCCNPAHLFLGTGRDNVQDMMQKGRFSAVRGERHGMAKLTQSAAATIREEAGVVSTVSDLAIRFGVSRRAVQFVVGRKTWA